MAQKTKQAKTTKENFEPATFGAGCFWGVEEMFRATPGVVETAVGYAGGEMKNPKYEDVCTDKTGHAEVVQLKFDPKKVTYEKLLELFFANHNPTTLNRQGPDIGTQYRSVIFFHSMAQQRAAQKAKSDLQNTKKFGGREIVTQISPAQDFYRAEEYHQKYLMKRGLDNCHI